MSGRNSDQRRGQDGINNVADEAETVTAAAAEARERSYARQRRNEVNQPIQQQQRYHPYAQRRNPYSSSRGIMSGSQYMDNHLRHSDCHDMTYIRPGPSTLPHQHPANVRADGTVQQLNNWRQRHGSYQQDQEVDTVLRLNTGSQPRSQPCQLQVQVHQSCPSQVQEQHLLQPHLNGHLPHHVARTTTRDILQLFQQLQSQEVPDIELQIPPQNLLLIEQQLHQLQSHFQPRHSSYRPPPQQQRPRVILPKNSNPQFHRSPQNQNQQHLVHPIVSSRQGFRAIRSDQTVTVANRGGGGVCQPRPPVVLSHNQSVNQGFVLPSSESLNQPVHMNAPPSVTGADLAPVRGIPVNNSHDNIIDRTSLRLGLSFNDAMDSPVIFNNSNILPSPTNGNFFNQGFNNSGETQQGGKENERNYSTFSFPEQQQQQTRSFTTSSSMFQSSSDMVVSAEPQNGNGAEWLPSSLPLHIPVRDSHLSTENEENEAEQDEGRESRGK